MAAFLSLGSRPALGDSVSVASYNYPVNRLGTGQSYGNQDCYVTLDGKTDIEGEQGSVRFGLRESTNQKYYLLAWDLSVAKTDGQATGTRFDIVRTCIADHRTGGWTPGGRQEVLPPSRNRVLKICSLPFEFQWEHE